MVETLVRTENANGTKAIEDKACQKFTKHGDKIPRST